MKIGHLSKFWVFRFPECIASVQDLLLNTSFSPDVQYHINSVAPYSDYGFLFHKIGGFKEDWYNDFYSSHYAKDAATILPVVLRPKS